MSGFLNPPAFVPYPGPIQLGPNTYVLTMSGGVPSFQPASGGSSAAILGARLAYASPAGGAVAANPAGFTNATGRLYVTLPSGDATWVSLPAGQDGQLCVVANVDAANTLILAAAGFATSGLILPAGHRGLIYYDSTASSWEVASG